MGQASGATAGLQELPGPGRVLQALRIAGLVFAVYYLGARVGLAFTLAPIPTAVLWPPNALLMGCLVLLERRWWWAAIAGALPAHLASELPHGIPPAMAACWFASNTLEALTGAVLVGHLCKGLDLDTPRRVVGLGASLVAASFVSSFADIACVKLLGWSGHPFPVLWQARFFANVLASLTVVPLFMGWRAAFAAGRHRQVPTPRLLELAGLGAGLLAATVFAFDSVARPVTGTPALLYLPMPFLIWAALRFGPATTTSAYALLVFVVIWGASQGRGPFLDSMAQHDAIPIQLFLICTGVSLLLLAAVTEASRDAERRLRASQELFSSAFRRSPIAIAISRLRDGAILEANERWRMLLGYGPAAPAAPLRDHLPGGQDGAGALPIQADCRDAEVVLRKRGGELLHVLLSTTDVHMRGEPCRISILRDITGQRRAEREALEQQRQLTHLSRVVSLSDFSGTIAHELNQPLAAILGNAQAALRLLARSPPDIAELRAILRDVVDADQRATLLIHHLRLLMKKGDEEFAELDLNGLVPDVLDLVRGEFPLRGVEVRTRYAPGLPRIHGDPVQLQQVILNLVCNACEAMQACPPGQPRVLTLATAHREGRIVQVAVTDTGPGIPAARLERIFEPFFSTKENGLGLGLAICRRIAHTHGGFLTVQSPPGRGATFRLMLPASRAGRRAGGQRDEAPPPAAAPAVAIDPSAAST